ncbi:glutathione S-transferase N-terminal domain-containing protein [Thalassolituus sp.]|uniref:glutathione S-transferase N-terminal domain-containing protein n=1 Tax=Thalassolituus sp. TaxID=2030822 RepID=UPI0035121CBF
MKLIYSTTSPFARKVWVAAIKLGLRDQITLEVANPLRNADVVSAANPLGKVPALRINDDQVVINSPVICQFLQRRAKNNVDLHQPSYMALDTTERVHTLADGIAEAAFMTVMEKQRPAEHQSKLWLGRWSQAIKRALTMIESGDIELLKNTPESIAEIALASALGYIDFRLPENDWREENPAIAQWYQEVIRDSELQETAPAD